MERSTPPNSAAAKDRQAQIRQILAILHKWGIHTLGQLAALDKEQLSARLGSEAVRLWERANGQSDRPLKLVRQPESFEESFEFENEIETAEPLLFILRRFLQQLAVRLSAIYLVAKEITLRITFANPPQDGSAAADKQHYDRCFTIPQPTNDVDLLFRMLQTHLENFKSEHPIVAVALDAQPVKPATQQFRLFETALRDPNQLSETLARLTGLLGADRVGTPVLEDSHQPDTFRIEPFAWNVSMRFAADSPRDESVRLADTAASTEEKKDGPGVALRRFRSAPAAAVLLDANKPAHLRSAQINGKVADQRGPYLASGNWWDEKSWKRAEWDLELQSGTVCRCQECADGWQLEGVYD
jgi:protein ImuB